MFLHKSALTIITTKTSAVNEIVAAAKTVWLVLSRRVKKDVIPTIQLYSDYQITISVTEYRIHVIHYSPTPAYSTAWTFEYVLFRVFRCVFFPVLCHVFMSFVAKNKKWSENRRKASVWHHWPHLWKMSKRAVLLHQTCHTGVNFCVFNRMLAAALSTVATAGQKKKHISSAAKFIFQVFSKSTVSKNSVTFTLKNKLTHTHSEKHTNFFITRETQWVCV